MELIEENPKTLAVVTGAYGGTGRAVARRLGARYRLVLAGRDEEKVAGLSESLAEEGYDVALAVTADVTSGQSVKHLAAVAGEEVAGSPGERTRRHRFRAGPLGSFSNGHSAAVPANPR